MKCALNSRILENTRKDRTYQCVIVDLVNIGIIGKDKAVTLLGYEIPSYLLTDKEEEDK